MSTQNAYLSADDIEDIRNAHGFGIPLSELAARVGVDEQQLRRWLGLPEWKRQPTQRRLAWDLETGK